MSRTTNHLSHVTCPLSPVTCHLTTTVHSISCYESPKRFGDIAVVDLVIDRVEKLQKTKIKFCQFLFGIFKEKPFWLKKTPSLSNKKIHQGDIPHQTDIATYRLYRLRGRFSEKNHLSPHQVSSAYNRCKIVLLRPYLFVCILPQTRFYNDIKKKSTFNCFFLETRTKPGQGLLYKQLCN